MKPRGPVGPGETATTPNGAPFPLRSWPPDAAVDIQLLAEWADKLGTWQAYTPTFGGALTLGNGTAAGRWTRIGKTVHFRAKVTLGSTSAMGTGTVDFVHPVNASATAPYFNGAAILTSAGNNSWTGIARGFAGWTSVSLSGTANHAGTSITPTTPFTWKATDLIEINGTYESV